MNLFFSEGSQRAPKDFRQGVPAGRLGPIRRGWPCSLRLALGLLALLASSCGSGVRLYPVRGQVFVGGQPAEGAIVVFHPLEPSESDAPKPSARVGADGAFILNTPRLGTGAPAGEYRVAIAWLGDPSQRDPRTGDLPLKLDPSFAAPESSPLRVRVEEGSNDIPAFQLPRWPA
jgi:hypothetical protein